MIFCVIVWYLFTKTGHLFPKIVILLLTDYARSYYKMKS
jgi:hypothetical protein